MSIFSRALRAILDIPLLAWPLLIIAMIPFAVFPELDLWISRLLYDPDKGFLYANEMPVQFIYHAVPVITAVTVGALVLLFLLGELRKRPMLGITRKSFAFLMLSLALGPGLVVHTGFKDHWGRARPAQVYGLGGTQRYSPPFIPSDQCAKNCSFVSGHASVGFYFISFALLARGKRKQDLMGGSIALGSLIGAGRILQGGHFLSDIVFSGFAVYFTAQILYNLFYPKEPDKLELPAVEVPPPPPQNYYY